MGIKEKNLEALILELLDSSQEVQRKIRSICSTSEKFRENSQTVSPVRKKFDDSETERLKNQLRQSQAEYQQASAKAQKYESLYLQLQSEYNGLKSENKNSEDKISRLESNLKKIKSESEITEKRFRDLKNDYLNIQENQQNLSASLAKANDNIQKLKERFDKPVILLEKYKSLPATIRTGLSDVVCDKNEILFIASFSASEHLKAVWTYTKKLAGSNGDESSIEVLKDIFDYFFEIFNSSLRQPMYVRDNVEVGYSFDDDKYDRCTGSATSGKISQVIMRGYKSVNTGAVICRSLVRV